MFGQIGSNTKKYFRQHIKFGGIYYNLSTKDWGSRGKKIPSSRHPRLLTIVSSRQGWDLHSKTLSQN